MAVGLPVVASRVGGIPELIEDGHNGLLVPPNDAASLARAISELLGDAAAADRLAIAARATVDERYSFERMTREFEATYRGELSSTLPIDAAPRPWANVFPRV
jgi:glycosyltransferase involved in cell wall biosynthesis